MKQPRAMTISRYKQCLETLRLSGREVARILGASRRLPETWALGRQSVPPKVAAWLEECARVREENPYPPPPRNWRRRPSGPIIGDEKW
jgi:hypothetical protein